MAIKEMVRHPTANQIAKAFAKAKGMATWAPEQARRRLLTAALAQAEDVIGLVLLVNHLKWIARNHKRLLDELEEAQWFDQDPTPILEKYRALQKEGEELNDYHN